MNAIVLDSDPNGDLQITPRDVPTPNPGPHDILIEVAACGVCRTELDQLERRIEPPRLPVIPGHQPVGTVVERGRDVGRFSIGDRVGATWIFSSCGVCKYCTSGRENLCPDFRGTGCHADGGYAQFMVVPESYAVPIPDALDDLPAVAPLLCAGVIGYRSLRLAEVENGMTFALLGFGSSNHLVLQMARHLYPDSPTYVYSRNPDERSLAMELGAEWTGDFDETPPGPIDSVVDTTPVWKPDLVALEHLAPGGRLVINAIRKQTSDQQELLALDYPRHLWMEKSIKSVANVTRQDGAAFISLAASMQLKPTIETYPLDRAPDALADLKRGRIRGSKVLLIGG